MRLIQALKTQNRFSRAKTISSCQVSVSSHRAQALQYEDVWNAMKCDECDGSRRIRMMWMCGLTLEGLGGFCRNRKAVCTFLFLSSEKGISSAEGISQTWNDSLAYSRQLTSISQSGRKFGSTARIAQSQVARKREIAVATTSGCTARPQRIAFAAIPSTSATDSLHGFHLITILKSHVHKQL